MVAFASKSWQTSASHGSEWESVINLALSIGCARGECCARIFAISSVVPNYADLLTRAIFVLLASLILDRLGN